jgi:hypothetical protein
MCWLSTLIDVQQDGKEALETGSDCETDLNSDRKQSGRDDQLPREEHRTSDSEDKETYAYGRNGNNTGGSSSSEPQSARTSFSLYVTPILGSPFSVGGSPRVLEAPATDYDSEQVCAFHDSVSRGHHRVHIGEDRDSRTDGNESTRQFQRKWSPTTEFASSISGRSPSPTISAAISHSTLATSTESPSKDSTADSVMSPLRISKNGHRDAGIGEFDMPAHPSTPKLKTRERSSSLESHVNAFLYDTVVYVELHDKERLFGTDGRLLASNSCIGSTSMRDSRKRERPVTPTDESKGDRAFQRNKNQ